jgi:hypothetical protein
MAKGLFRDDDGWVQVDYGSSSAPIPRDQYEANGYQPPFDRLPLRKDYEAAISEISLSSSDVTRYMDEGATLIREFGQSSAQLRTADNIFFVPASIIDSLIDQHQIEAVVGGHFRRKK